MKKLLMIPVLLFAGALWADPVTCLDPNGRLIGTATTDGNITTYRDRDSKIIGTATPSGNKTTYQDAGGRIIGSVSCGENNDFTRDAFLLVQSASRFNFWISFPE